MSVEGRHGKGWPRGKTDESFLEGQPSYASAATSHFEQTIGLTDGWRGKCPTGDGRRRSAGWPTGPSSSSHRQSMLDPRAVMTGTALTDGQLSTHEQDGHCLQPVKHRGEWGAEASAGLGRRAQLGKKIPVLGLVTSDRCLGSTNTTGWRKRGDQWQRENSRHILHDGHRRQVTQATGIMAEVA